jgi:hypothetical protein
MPALSRTTETLVSFTLATVVLGAGALGWIASGPALFVGAAFAALGGFALAREGRANRVRRERADAQLVSLTTNEVPRGLRWRAVELTRARERRRLAESLRSLLRTADDPVTASRAAVPLNRLAILRQRRAVEEIAAALADMHRPISARAVILVRRLLLDGLESPLYSPQHADELGTRLARVRALLSSTANRRRGGETRR